PAQTRLRLTIDAQSPFHGGRVTFERADGEAIGQATLTAGTIEEVLPASGRFTLSAPDGTTRTEYLINANAELTQLQRYLYRGRFLRDFPNLQPGDLPVEAWRLADFKEVMQRLSVSR